MKYRVHASTRVHTYMEVDAATAEDAVDFAHEEGFPDVELVNLPHGRSGWAQMASDQDEWVIDETAERIDGNE